MKKKISLVLAGLLCITMIATACNNQQNIGDSSSSPIIESTTGADESPIVSVTDAEGNAVTDAEGNAVTEIDASKIQVVDPESTTVATTVNKTSQGRYAYSKLNKEEQALYGTIVNSVKSLNNVIHFDKEVPFATYQKVMALVYYQEPELFWLSGKYETYNGSRDSVPVYYKTTDTAEIKKMQGEIDAKTKEFLDGAPSGSQMDKLVYLHDWVILHNAYSKDDLHADDIYGGLVGGVAQCQGYSKTSAYLMDKMGIENTTVTGFNEEGLSHAWNLVKLDGEWYNFDTTWDDPKGMKDADYIRYSFFNVTDDEIYGKTHTLDTSYYESPKCTGTKNNYSKVKGQYVSSVDEAKKCIEQQLVANSKSGGSRVFLKCASKEAFDSIYKDLVSNKGLIDVIDATNKNNSTSFTADGVGVYKEEHIYCIDFKINKK